LSNDLKQPMRFVVVGAVNTLFGLMVIFALKAAFGMDDFVANLVGYGFGLLVSLVLNSRWTFRYRGELRAVVPRFAAVVTVAYLANWIVVRSFLGQGVDGYLSQAMGVIPYAVVSYVGMKRLVYARHQQRHR
jgi:putative flippase GtrA